MTRPSLDDLLAAAAMVLALVWLCWATGAAVASYRADAYPLDWTPMEASQ